jgi:Domain of Unknown Function with PDB structure (DUF3857)/Transglutaminase-like superfamily
MIRRTLLALFTFLVASNALAWGSSAPDWLKALAKAPLPSYPADTAGVVLLDETVVTVGNDGAIQTTHRRAVKILGTEGRDLGYLAIHYDADTRIGSLNAWGLGANGEEYRVKDGDAVESAAFEGALYADYKLKVLRIPAAQPGNVIGYEYTQTEHPWALQQIWQLQSEVPARTVRYTLELPEGWSHEERWMNAAALQPRVAGRQTTWESTDVAAIKEEPDMPPVQTVAARMAINFIPPQEQLQGKAHRTWNDVGRWFYGLAEPRRAATPELQAKTRALLAGKTTALEKIAALAAFAQRDVRYVAIEIGIGAVQPHPAGAVFTNRFGDCKDKVTVLSAMLHEAGIESYYALANSERGVVDPSFASMAECNHAIIAIKLPDDAPAKGLYSVVNHPKLGRLLLFDPTSETTPLGYLPDDLQESRVVVVTANGGEIVDVPAHPPEANRLDLAAKLTLDGSGALAGDVRYVRTGLFAAHMRARLATMNESERKQYVERTFASHLPQSSVSDLVIENLDDLDKDLVVRCKLTANGYAKRAAGMLLVRPRVLGRKADSIDMSARKFDYVMQGPSLETDDIEIVMPAGFQPDELPAAAAVKTPALSYTSETKFEESKLHYRRQFRVQAFDVPLNKLAELNKAFAQIGADERSSAVFK